MLPLSVVRYKLKTFGEVGAVQFRQSYEDPASTEIVFLDADGLDFSSNMGKSVERTFYKENFRRAHEPGAISELANVVDFYRDGFFRAVHKESLKKGHLKVVIDFNHSPASLLLPSMLHELGCDVIALNAYLEEDRVARLAEDKPNNMQQLAKITTTLEARAGFWLDPNGEAILMIDEAGKIYESADLLVTVAALLIKSGAKGSFAVPVSAPSTLERMAQERGSTVIRTKSSERSMLEASLSSEVVLAGSMDGRFAFPKFQSAFDGMFCIAKIIELLAATGIPLSKVTEDVPSRVFLQTKVSCIWEMKGGVMRKMSEDSVDKEATFIDGIKVSFRDEWVLVLPDQYQPFVHIIAEAGDQKTAQRRLNEYQDKVEKWKKELQ
jgi:mannose-1-phosphate guanylyltransferase/phosphomannomutase